MEVFLTILACILSVTVICLSVINILFADKLNSFFVMNVSQSFTIIIAIVLTYFANRHNSKNEKRKNHIISIIGKIQSTIVSKDFISIEPGKSDIKYITMNNRDIENKINILKQYAKDFKTIKEDVEYISNEFFEYKTFVSEHLNDLKYLSESKPTLTRHMQNINSKCEAVIFSLLN